jgi:hypothetical protein
MYYIEPTNRHYLVVEVEGLLVAVCLPSRQNDVSVSATALDQNISC